MSLALKTSLLFSNTMDATLCGCFSPNPNSGSLSGIFGFGFIIFSVIPFPAHMHSCSKMSHPCCCYQSFAREQNCNQGAVALVPNSQLSLCLH